jgi:hypothetical protein
MSANDRSPTPRLDRSTTVSTPAALRACDFFDFHPRWLLGIEVFSPTSSKKSHALRITARRGNAPIAVLAFLLLFAILLVAVSNFYLLPAIDAAKNATPDEKRRLMAFSRLLLALVLFILFVGLMMTFRIGRFFFPRASKPRTQTKYVDVWAEAGRRLDTADPGDENE